MFLPKNCVWTRRSREASDPTTFLSYIAAIALLDPPPLLSALYTCSMRLSGELSTACVTSDSTPTQSIPLIRLDSVIILHLPRPASSSACRSAFRSAFPWNRRSDLAAGASLRLPKYTDLPNRSGVKLLHLRAYRGAVLSAIAHISLSNTAHRGTTTAGAHPACRLPATFTSNDRVADTSQHHCFRRGFDFRRAFAQASARPDAL